MSESCLKGTSHVANDRVMTHMGVVGNYFRFLSLAGVSLSHVTNERVMSHINESCRKWLSNDTRKWLSNDTYGCYGCLFSLSFARRGVTASCHIWTSHVTNKRVMSHMTEACHIWMRHLTCEYVMLVNNEADLTMWMLKGIHGSDIFTYNIYSHLIMWMNNVTYGSDIYIYIYVYNIHMYKLNI